MRAIKLVRVLLNTRQYMERHYTVTDTGKLHSVYRYLDASELSESSVTTWLRGGNPRIVRGRRKFQRAHAWSPDLDQHTDGKLRRRRILLSRPNFDSGPWIRVKSARIRALRAELRSTAYYSCVPSIHAWSKKDKAVYTDTILAWPPCTSHGTSNLE